MWDALGRGGRLTRLQVGEDCVPQVRQNGIRKADLLERNLRCTISGPIDHKVGALH